LGFVKPRLVPEGVHWAWKLFPISLGDYKVIGLFSQNQEPRRGHKRGLNPLFGLGPKLPGKYLFLGKNFSKQRGKPGGLTIPSDQGLTELKPGEFWHRESIRDIGGDGY